MPPLPMPVALPTPAPAPPRLVLLAPATAGITPVSSKPSRNKQIAMEFVSANKEKQTQMLRDPAVARAILQTLAESPQTGQPPPPGQPPAPLGPPPPLMGPPLGPGVLPGPPPPLGPPVGPPSIFGAGALPLPVAGPQPPPVWSGLVTLARNMGKRLTLRAALMHGRIQDVEVALRSAAGNMGVLDITHRVPFEEAARRARDGTVLSMAPPTPLEQLAFEEYAKYFRSKMRAGVARLDGQLALYVLPPGDDIPSLAESVYSLGPHIPRVGCLLAVIAPGTAAVMSAPAPGKGPAAAPAAAAMAAPVGVPSAEKAAGATAQADSAGTSPPPKRQRVGEADQPAAGGAAAQEADDGMAPPVDSAAPAPAPAAAGAEGDGGGDGDGGMDMSSKELMDLFSNPELIKLLSDDKAEGQGAS